MNSNNDGTLGIALVKELCPVCLKAYDGPIILNEVLSKKNAAEVKTLNGQVVGFKEDICEECMEKLKNYRKERNISDLIFVVGVDSDLTEDKRNPYRTGKIGLIPKSCITSQKIEKHMVYTDFKEKINLT